MKARTENRIECERRGRQDIIMGILQTAEHGSKKPQIINKVRLSFTQATKYLGSLKEKGYVLEESDMWKTTKSGLQLVEACKICHTLMNEP